MSSESSVTLAMLLLLQLCQPTKCPAKNLPQKHQSQLTKSELIEGEVEVVLSGYGFTEGPLWLPAEKHFIFSDIPADTIYTDTGRVFRMSSGKSNGLTMDSDGRLLICQHLNRRVIRVEKDNSITVLADQFDGMKLNSPNDLVLRSDGTLYFSDPPFGLMYFGPKRESELKVNGVYRMKQGGDLQRVVDDMQMPNGLAFSPDEKVLYVSDDIEEGYIRAYDVAQDGSLSNPRVFATGLIPDGMKVDTNGNIWCTSRYEVVVFRQDGYQLGSITFPQKTANLAFGGHDSRTLIVTARNGVYRIRTKIPGLHPGGPKG